MLFTKEAATSIVLSLLAIANSAQGKVAIPSAYSELQAIATSDGVVINDADSTTLFAPTNAAFESLKSAAPQVLYPYNVDILSNVVNDHILGSKVLAADLPAEATTQNGNKLSYDGTEGISSGTTNLAKITATDIEATDDHVTHEVDAVVVVPGVVPEHESIKDLATANGLTVLASIIPEGKLTTVSDTEGVTVFAPNNDAFEKLFAAHPILKVDSELTTEAIGNVLNHHVVGGSVVKSSDLQEGANQVTTDLGTTYDVVATAGVVTINDATVVVPNARAWAGVAHVIDQVLVPEAAAPYVKTVVDVAQENDFKTLVSLVTTANLVETLKSSAAVTVLAPTDAAFTKLGAIGNALTKEHNLDVLANVLTFHVIGENKPALDATNTALNGGTIEFADGKVKGEIGDAIEVTTVVATPEKQIQQSTVHVIDSVLLPKGLPATNIAALAVEKGLSSLVAAVTQAKINAILEATDGEPYTVFAPSNEAFATFLDGKKLDDIAADDLAEVLKFHVVKGAVSSADLKSQEYTTLSGETISVDVAKNTVNGVKIAQADLRAYNGYVHVIESVLVEEAGEEEGGASTISTFVAAFTTAVAAAFIM